MVIRLPVRPPRIAKILKPYVLEMHLTNKYIKALVIHAPTNAVATSACSDEKSLRKSLENKREVEAASLIGRILGERMLLRNIPTVSVVLDEEQHHNCKVKAVLDSMKEVGVKLL